MSVAALERLAAALFAEGRDHMIGTPTACPSAPPISARSSSGHDHRRPPSATLDACARKVGVDADCLA
jgi:hypothetical protein